MSDPATAIDAMINAAHNESPSDFQDAFATAMLDRIAATIDAKKIEIAKNYFNYEDAEANSVEQEEAPNEDTEATA